MSLELKSLEVLMCFHENELHYFFSKLLSDTDLDIKTLHLIYKVLNIQFLKLDLAEDLLTLKSTDKTVLFTSWCQQCWLKLGVLKWLFLSAASR